MARQDRTRERRPPAEGPHRPGALPPVGVDEHLRDPHGDAVFTQPIPPEEQLGHLLKPRVQRRLKARPLRREGERPLRVLRLKERRRLVGIAPVGDDVPAKRLVPRADHPEEEFFLHVHEARKRLVVEWDFPTLKRRDPRRQRPLVELVARDVVRHWRVLILRQKRRLAAVDPQIPCVLDRGQLVFVFRSGHATRAPASIAAWLAR